MGVVPRQARLSCSQIVLCCIGLLPIVTGFLLATVIARKEATPPLKLSVIDDQAGQSVANVSWGSTGPIGAQLEIVDEGRVLWPLPLSGGAVEQRVILPSNLLGSGLRVSFASKGHSFARG